MESGDHEDGFIQCCKYGINDAVKLYLSIGVNPACGNNEALKMAIRNNHLDTFELLLDQMPDVDYESIIMLVFKESEGDLARMIDLILSRGSLLSRDLIFSEKHSTYLSDLFYLPDYVSPGQKKMDL
jgi:ankyrin repeat protein